MGKLEEFKVGDYCSGLVFDNMDTPQIYGMYAIDKDYGPILKVSYPSDAFGDDPEDSLQLASWENSKKVPKALDFLCTEGVATFHESVLIRKKHNFAGVTEITMRPTSITFGRHGHAVSDIHKVTTFKSRISGLHLWLGQDAIKRKITRTADSRANSINLSGKSVQPITFNLGDMSVELSSPWVSEEHGTIQSIVASGQISTSSPSPITLGEHLDVHRRLQALLSLSSGNAVNFHRHFAHLEQESEPSPVIHFSTYHEHASLDEDQSKDWEYLSRYSNAETQRLKAWLDGSGIWNDRALPLIKLLQRKQFWAEDRIIYSGITAENLGKKLPPAEGEEQTYSVQGHKIHATWVYRCLKYSCIEHESLPFDLVQLSRAIANNYNKTKHFADDKTPEISVSGFLGRFFVVVLRQVLIRLATNDDATTSPLFPWDKERFDSIRGLQNIRIDADGWPTYFVVSEEQEEQGSDIDTGV